MNCTRFGCGSLMFWEQVSDLDPLSSNTYELFPQWRCPMCSHTVSEIAEENRARRPEIGPAKRGMVGV